MNRRQILRLITSGKIKTPSVPKIPLQTYVLRVPTQIYTPRPIQVYRIRLPERILRPVQTPLTKTPLTKTPIGTQNETPDKPNIPLGLFEWIDAIGFFTIFNIIFFLIVVMRR